MSDAETTTPPTSPHTKLRKKLEKQKAQRAPGNGPKRERRKRPEPTPTQESTTDKLEIFPEWLTRQLVRSWPEVSHNRHPFMLLFKFDMSADPLTHDPTVMVGSRLDVMLIKVNGGIYYLSSTHMDGLQKRVQRDIKVTPAQLLYVCDPANHAKNAIIDLSVNIQALQYIATIPSEWVREKKEWDVPLDPATHLPHIKRVEQLPGSEE